MADIEIFVLWVRISKFYQNINWAGPSKTTYNIKEEALESCPCCSKPSSWVDDP